MFECTIDHLKHVARERCVFLLILLLILQRPDLRGMHKSTA